jgi:hypothetical protein
MKIALAIAVFLATVASANAQTVIVQPKPGEQPKNECTVVQKDGIWITVCR